VYYLISQTDKKYLIRRNSAGEIYDFAIESTGIQDPVLALESLCCTVAVDLDIASEMSRHAFMAGHRRGAECKPMEVQP
jgi:hypothetical protein